MAEQKTLVVRQTGSPIRRPKDQAATSRVLAWAGSAASASLRIRRPCGA